MKKLLPALFLAIGLLGAQRLAAQTKDTVKTANWFGHSHSGAAQIQVTYRETDLGQLNRILNNSGIPSLKNNDIWINLSMQHNYNNWIFEDGIGATPESSSNINNLYARYNQYQVYGRIAYNFSTTPDIRLFPFAGVNFSAAVLDIDDKNRVEDVNNFSSEILNSTSSKTFYQPNFGIEVGGGMDYLIKVKDKDMGCFNLQRNIPVGVRVGYYFNTYQGDWRIDNYSLQNGPDTKKGEFFVSLNIGLGYEVKK